MPPHLHPRSTATSTLFAGTLLVSFIAVGIPHVFPCPVPRRNYADSERKVLDQDGNPIPRRTRDQRQGPTKASTVSKSADVKSRSLQDEAELFKQLQKEAEMLEIEARECPVPKPRGLIGRVLGFESQQPQAVPEQEQQDRKA